MKSLRNVWFVPSVCLFDPLAATAAEPAFTKETQCDRYVLAAHQDNKNIAQKKLAGLRVAVSADGVVWHPNTSVSTATTTCGSCGE